MPGRERQAPKEAALSGVLGGWSGAAFSSTSLKIAEFWTVSRGNFLMGTRSPQEGEARGGATFLMPVAICKSGTSCDQFSDGCGRGADSAVRQLLPAQAWSRVRSAESFPR